MLVTTLTKKMSEDLTDYLLDAGVRTRYLHSEVDTLKRIELLRDLRLGDYDVLVGINLLREGLDLPEVSLVSILDADKEGFLRSDKSLIQTIGRAARNVSGQVHMYADRITPSMETAIDETNRRRAKQVAYNTATASTRRRCARRSPTSPRCSPARTRTPRSCWRPGSTARRRSRRRRRCPACPRSSRTRVGVHAADLAGLPSAELAELIQQLTDQMKACRGRAAVRARRPAARRDQRAEEGAPADDGGGRPLSR